MLPGATSRRGFFGVLAGAVAAPIVVRSGVLTPVKAPITVPAQSVPPIQIFTPRNSWLSTDGRLCAPLEWLACQRRLSTMVRNVDAVKATVALSDAELAADLRAAAENYNQALRSIKAAALLLDASISAATAAGVLANQEGRRLDTITYAPEITFRAIHRPL